ncbi:hypothetical protein HDU86_006141 [Geranomyces michiganensis]|nr:hypothetical protein HDU86_006141 [Geranomyces michiganensis]
MARMAARQPNTTAMKRLESQGLSNMAAAAQLFDKDLKESDSYELKERRGHVGVDANGIPLYAYLNSVLFPGDHDRLMAAMEALFADYPPKLPTTDGRHLSPALQLVSFAVNVLFVELDPRIAEKYRNACKASEPGLQDVWAGNPYQVLFAMIVLIINEYVLKHRDLRDAKDGRCAVVCLGTFDDGEFCLPDLKIRIPFQPCDILFIRSFALEHMVRKWSNGNRYMIVFKMHEGIIDVV